MSSAWNAIAGPPRSRAINVTAAVQRAARAAASDNQPVEVDAQLVGVGDRPEQCRVAVVGGGRERALGGEAIVDTHDDAAVPHRPTGLHPRESLGVEDAERAAVEVEQHRQPLAVAGVVRPRHHDPHVGIALGPGDEAFLHRDPLPVLVGQLHPRVHLGGFVAGWDRQQLVRSTGHAAHATGARAWGV